MGEKGEEGFITGPLYFRNGEEFADFWRLKQGAWTKWYAADLTRGRTILERAVLNGKALCFPEFFREIRTEENIPVGYLFTVPAYWTGSPAALQNLDYYDSWHSFRSRYHMLAFGAGYIILHALKLDGLFRACLASYRARKLAGCNTMILTAIFARPEFRGMRIPARLFASIKEVTAGLGFSHLISPFRPSEYGRYKRESGLVHDYEIFKRYCCSTREDGLPVDAWLRALTRNGMIMLKPEIASFTVTRPLGCFEEFRRSHKPGQWYQTSPGVWECGETQTWYIDEHCRTAFSIEPDLWGLLPLG